MREWWSEWWGVFVLLAVVLAIMAVAWDNSHAHKREYCAHNPSDTYRCVGGNGQ